MDDIKDVRGLENIDDDDDDDDDDDEAKLTSVEDLGRESKER